MSNRNDFDFDDDFFDGDDDETPLPGDDEFPMGFGEDEGDIPVTFEEPIEERRGGNRTFIILAAVMIILFLVGLAVVLLLALRPQELTAFDQTSTAIADANNQIATFAAETATQNALLVFATQTADAFTDTPTPPPTATPVPTETTIPTIDPTDLAATMFIDQTRTAVFEEGLSAQQTATAAAQQATQDALATENALTQQAGTAVFVLPTQGPGGINETATAIAAQFLALTASAAPPVGPTQEVGFGTPVVRQTALPQTGLFDDVVAGGRDGIGVLALAVVGLVGVIVIARQLRVKSDEEPKDNEK